MCFLVIYGNPSAVVSNDSSDWDGVGTSAKLSDPAYLIQTQDPKYIYFIDLQSCLRRADRETKSVTTILGELSTQRCKDLA